MSTIYSVPRDSRHHHKYKKVLYLEPPRGGSKTVRTRVTTIIPGPAPRTPSPAPAPCLPEPIPEPQPPIIVAPPPPPPPPPAHYLPPPPPRTPLAPEHEPDTSIEVIAVDVDPSDSPPRRSKSHKSHKSSRSSHSVHSSHSSHSSHSNHSSSSRRSHSRGPSLDREVYIEREKLVPYRVPVPYPVRVQPEYETYRYVEAAPRSPSRRQSSPDREIIIEDRRRRRYVRD